MKKAILILMLSIGTAFAAQARTNVIIINNSSSSCNPEFDMWGTIGTPPPPPNTFPVFSTGTGTLPFGTTTLNCQVDIIHVEFDWPGGATSNGFPVSMTAGSGSGTFSGGGCLGANSVSYTWTYTSGGGNPTCSGVSTNTLTITIF
jgi:hypothetical protein